MAVYVISDLHLSTLDSTNKSMEVFGHRWQDYVTRLRANWTRLVEPSDTVIIPGDVSWALTLDEAHSDLSFIDSLPGRKIIGKGNHDFWWSTMNKLSIFTREKRLDSLSFLFNNAYLVENIIVTGTRGWYQDADCSNLPSGTDYDKLVRRECQRLEMSLRAAEPLRTENPQAEVVAFLHFPPYYNGRACEEIVDVLLSYGVKRVYYGHLHGDYTIPATVSYKGIDFTLVSADYLEFIPKNAYQNKKV